MEGSWRAAESAEGVAVMGNPITPWDAPPAPSAREPSGQAWGEGCGMVWEAASAPGWAELLQLDCRLLPGLPLGQLSLTRCHQPALDQRPGTTSEGCGGRAIETSGQL